MTINVQPPPLDPFDPDVHKASDIPIAEGGSPNPLEAAPLVPNREALATFSAAIFKNADPGGFVSIRAFKDNSKKDETAIIVEAITIGHPSYLDVVFERARQAAQWPEPVVFCPPITTLASGKNAKTDNIHEGVTLSVDCDARPVAARGALEAILGKPTIAVASGGEWTNPDTGEIERKCHLHWRLKVPTKTEPEHKLLREARDLATTLVGGDATGVSLVHPFRWPGSWHRKGSPKLAEIIDNSDTEIDLHEALAELREASGRSAPRDTQTKTGGGSLMAALRTQLASNPDHVALALREIPNNDVSRKDWNQMGMAIWGATGGSDAGLKAFEEWSAKAPTKSRGPGASRVRWEHFETSPPSRIGFGTLVYLARQNTPGWTVDGVTVGEPDWRERRANGKPIPSMHNARLAITALGITCSKDVFHNKTLFGYCDDSVKHELASVVGEVSDDGIIALRLLMSQRFGFDLEDKATRDAVKSLAGENCFNPVCDLIDQAETEWDGVGRLDRMAADYLNCEDTPLNAAFMRKTMIGLIKRAREPGCKFDTIVVLESGEGFNKSTAWRILAGDENFSDESIIGKSSREVQEQLSEVWIHENADLAGMRKTDIETVKAYASRMVDIARPAFGHFTVKQARHSIEVGTTNSIEYLQSQTGNRRFWPMKVLKAIDIDKLRRDRLQLIGEAARYQSAGESVVLDEAMWDEASAEQEHRRTKDPWENALEHIPMWWDTIEGYDSDHHPIKKGVLIIHLVDDQEVVSAATLLKHILEIPIGHQTQATTMRLSTVMKQLGWQRHKNGYVSIDRERVKGYFRPSAPTLATNQRIHPMGLSDMSDLSGPEVAPS
jgi:predicted P-loop ATPase